MEFKGKYGNLALGVLSIVTGLAIVFLTRVQGLEFIKNGMPGAGMFPTLCGIAIVVCGALLLVEIFIAMERAKRHGEQDPDLEKNLINLHELRNLLIFVLLGGFILVLSDYIGLLTCLCISMIVYIKVQGKDPWWKAIVISVCTTIFLYAVFVWFLRVPVPKGPLGF